MTVYEFMSLCIDKSLCNVILWDIDNEEEIYNGPGDEIPTEYEDAEIGSFDVPTQESITLNIETNA